MTYTPEQIAAHIADRAQHVGEDSKDVRILRQLLAECDAAWGEAVSAAAVVADKHYAAGDMETPATTYDPSQRTTAMNDLREQLAITLRDAWYKADPESAVTKHPVSFVSNFADQADAIIAALQETSAKVRSDAINEFALSAGIPLSDVAKNLPRDVKEYRMNSAVAAMQARRKSGAKS